MLHQTEAVLFNPVILDGIFSKLDPGSVAISRLVCRIWADVGAVATSRRELWRGQLWHLDLNKVFECCTLAPESPVITIKLVRSIRIRDECSRDAQLGSPLDEAAAPNFVNFVTIYNQSIRSIAISGSNLLANTLFKLILSPGLLPSLQSIRIRVWRKCDQEGKIESETLSGISTRFSLKSISLAVDSVWSGQEEEEERWIFAAKFYALISSAPNLERLFISGNLCPNLESNKNLKALSFRVEEHWNPTIDPSFKMDKINEILYQIRDSVEEIELSASFWNPPESQKMWLRLPKMRNLTRLILESPQIYRPDKCVFNAAVFPKLNFLRLGGDYGEDPCGVDNCLKTMSSTSSHLSLESIHLPTANYISSDAAEGATRVFPNIKKLQLKVDTVLITNGKRDEEMQALIQSLEKYHVWNLTHAKLHFRDVSSMEDALFLATCASRFKGKQRLRLMFTLGHNPTHNATQKVVIEKLSQELMDLLLVCKGLESAEILFLVVTTQVLDEIKDFFVTHNLSNVALASLWVIEAELVGKYRVEVMGAISNPSTHIEWFGLDAKSQISIQGLTICEGYK